MLQNTLLKGAFVALLSTAYLNANSSDNMAESLMKLRGEVESLNTQIKDENDAYRASMKSLVRQKNDLESVIGREDLKIKQLEQELAKVQDEIKKSSKNSKGLKPLVVEAIGLLKTNIEQGIPFKTADRLAELTKIQTQLDNNLITPQKALSYTYNAYADLLRMSKENGIFKQTILLDGKDRLVQVARVGTVMIFFKTADERVGYVTRDTDGWFYKEVLDKDSKKEIVVLFDAFTKQIRSGYFTLPNALVTSRVK